MTHVDAPGMIWVTLTEFPNYKLNYLGEVRTVDSDADVPHSKFDGIAYVELMRDGKPYLQHVNRLRWKTFPLPGFPPLETDVNRHGPWSSDMKRYADGESAHPCGMNCSVGAV
jgi:hypothetical protein